MASLNGSTNDIEKGSAPFGIQNNLYTEKEDDGSKKFSGDLEPDGRDVKDNSSWNVPTPATRPPFFSSQSIQEKAVLVATNITIEPLLFTYVFCMALGMVTTQSLVIRKFCLLDMNLTIDVCTNLTNNKILEAEAQTLSSTLSMYKTLLESGPAVILAVFLGSWSDKHGRKLLLLLPNVGNFLHMILMICYAHFMLELEPRYLLLASVPSAIMGGMMPIMVGAAAYISDVSTRETRIIRLGVMQACALTGAPLASIIGAAILKQFGYPAVYIVSAVMSVFCILYVIFYLKETVKKADGPIHPCSDFFDLTYVRQGFQTCFRKRDNNHRTHLILLMFAMTINFFPVMGEMSVSYLYARVKFRWSELTYSYYTASTLLATMFGLLLVLPLLKMIIHVPDIAIALIGAACRICSESMIAFAPEGWLLFMVAPFLIFAGMYSPILRGMMSHIVSNEEQGKLYSVVGACEAAMPAVGIILYTNVYKATVSTFPGAVFLMSAAFFVIPTVIFVWIRHDINRRQIVNNTVTSPSGVKATETTETAVNF